MTDFIALIDNAIKSGMRTRLAEFLRGFQPIEFGRLRALNSEQRALVLTELSKQTGR